MLEINKIYNMDFREGLSSLPPAKIFVTDPPYNIDFCYNDYKDNLFDDDYIELLSNLQQLPLAIIHYPEETIKYIAPALGVPDEVIVWCYNSNIPKQSRLINFYNIIPDFNKVKQPYKNPNDKRVKKLIENGSSGTRLYDWFSDIQLVKNVSKEKNHPCPVPIELMKRIILLTTEENDLVCDPFMGSGTTALACKEIKRNYIGFEISREYCDIADKRLLLLEK
jgi:site-specific DNA-methyltransferase (adenine-specific)